MQVFGDIETYIGIAQLLIRFLIELPFRSDFFFTREAKIGFEYEFPTPGIEAMNALARNTFPETFFFGVATSYQTENARNMNDKTESIWDYMTDANFYNPYRTNANIACNLYQNYKEDIALAKNLHARMFKLSLRWSKILPRGFAGPVNEEALDHYNAIIDEMLANDITPMVTLFHWDTPNLLQQLGGWTNPMIVEWFKAYAKIAFTTLGDKVKYWVTVEDPVTLCTYGYGGSSIPTLNLSGVADYICGHYVLLAHAKVYKLYQEQFKLRQKGKVGIIHNTTWFEPEDPNSQYDVAAVETGFQWYNSWLMNPLFGKHGDYPKMMKDRITFKSRIQEFPDSRLPSFTREEINEIKGSADFLGVNFYSAKRVHGLKLTLNGEVAFDRDADIQIIENNDWPGEAWIKNTPWALGKLLRRLSNDFMLPEIYITGNGYADDGKIEDVGRMVYHHQHLSEILRAMQAGVDIRGYLAWSLVDNFEWTPGHRTSFGLFYVEDTNITRKPKLSSSVIWDIYKTGTIRPIMDVTGLAVSL